MAEYACLGGPLGQFGEDREQRKRELAHARGFLQMLPPVLIFAVEQSDELGMRAVIVPGESDQSLHGFAGGRAGEREPLLRFTKLLVGLLEHAAKQLFLAAEV